MTQTVKELTVLARGQHKSNAKAVAYLVLSSNGQDKYETTVYDGKASHCTCAARTRCYHMNGCEQLEASRNYDVIGEAVKLFDKATEDARYGDFYEQRAEQMRKDAERTALLNYELSLGI